MEWHESVDIARKYVFRISTPRGSGTGFLVSTSGDNNIIAVATAAHVVDTAHYWEEPIRLDHAETGGSVLLHKDDRVVILEENRDSAAIILTRPKFELPTTMLTLVPEDKYLKVGEEIGWLGYPAIPSAGLCFFGGQISAWLHAEDAYLVDGVAINGVSGGPVFHRLSKSVALIGIVSAYAPNRATGETLPGLSIIRDVTQFHKIARTFASLDEARKKESTVPQSGPPPAPPELPQKAGDGAS